jgi:DNA-binding NarL/FixJ family response regulator
VISRYALMRLGMAAMVNARPSRAVVVDTAAQDGHLQYVDVALYDLASLHLGETGDDLQHLLDGKIPVVGIERDQQGHHGDGAKALGVKLVVPEQVSTDSLLETLEEAAGRRHRTSQSAQHGILSARELSVVRLIAAGRTNTEIAHELFLSMNTVKTYIRTAYKKMGITHRTEAVLWALRNGLAPFD